MILKSKSVQMLFGTLYSLLFKGRGRTVNMFWSQERRPVASTCCVRATPTICCRPGVTMAQLEVAGRLSRGDRMDLLTFSGRGINTR